MSTSTPGLEIAMRSIGPVSLVSARRARNPTNLADRTCNFQQGFRGKNLQKRRWNVHSTWPIGGKFLATGDGIASPVAGSRVLASRLSPGSRFWWLRGPATTCRQTGSSTSASRFRLRRWPFALAPRRLSRVRNPGVLFRGLERVASVQHRGRRARGLSATGFLPQGDPHGGGPRAYLRGERHSPPALAGSGLRRLVARARNHRNRLASPS